MVDQLTCTGRPLRRTLALIGLVLVFVALRLVHWAAERADRVGVFTDHVVVVGVTGRFTADRDRPQVLGAHLDDAQAGSWSSGRATSATARPRAGPPSGPAAAPRSAACASRAWTGRRSDRLGRPAGRGGRPRRRRPARHAGRIGLRAASAAVGPGAALAAARPDGSLAAYATWRTSVRGGEKLSCPITLVDAGAPSDPVITALASRPDVTLIVTGIGPPAGSDDPGPGRLPDRDHPARLADLGQHAARGHRHADRPHPRPCRLRPVAPTPRVPPSTGRRSPSTPTT